MLMMLLALVPDASAVNLKWYGAGPSLSTMLFPGQYPISFPAGAKTDGKASGDPLVDKVGFDLNLGGRGVIYPTKSMRLGARLDLGFGSGYGHQEFLLEYGQVFNNEGSFQVVGSVGLGVGHERFRSSADDGYLDVNYYPIRGEIGGLLRDKWRAYELALWGTFHIAGQQQYFESPDDQDPRDGKGESIAAGSLYVGIGLQATVWFGDFRSSESNTGGNNSGGSKKKSSNNGNNNKSGNKKKNN